MVDQSAFVRFGTTNMILPPEGPKAYPMTLDFTNANEQTTDFSAQIGPQGVSFIQAFFVDNHRNANVLFVTSQNIGQTIPIPPFAVGYLPMFISPNNGFLTWTTVQAANLIVPIVVTNTPVTPYLWEVIAP